MSGAGIRDHLIAHIGGAVDPDRSRSHLRNGHNVSECAFSQPSVDGDNLCLDEGEHRIASSESEEPYDEEHPEELQVKFNLSHCGTSFP